MRICSTDEIIFFAWYISYRITCGREAVVIVVKDRLSTSCTIIDEVASVLGSNEGSGYTVTVSTIVVVVYFGVTVFVTVCCAPVTVVIETRLISYTQ